VRIGLNAGFGDPIKHELGLLTDLGFQIVRQDLYARFHDAPVQQLVSEFVGETISPLFLIGGGHIQRPDQTRRIEPDELATWARDAVRAAEAAGLATYAIEVGNEPDIAHRDYATRPQDFAVAVQQTHAAVRNEGFTGDVITGGIANLDRRGFRYLTGMMSTSIADDVVIGFHRYPERGKGPQAPHRGFTSREDEWSTLRGIVGSHRLACTEFGYNTAPEKTWFGLRSRRRTDDEVAASVLWDFAFFRDHECELAILYQLNDGPDATDRFGIRRVDGTLKPVAERIRAEFRSV